jgi:RNA polymerase sigma factor (sigma-70 family)
MVVTTDFAGFYDEARNRCLSAVLVTVRDHDLAEDLVAEAFTRAWARWGQLADRDNPSAWVVRTALNLSVSRWRRQRRELPLGEQDEVTWANEPLVDPTVMTAVLALPRRQREVIALRIIMDLDATQAARILDITPATVGVHLHRALTSLSQTLSREETQS